MTFQNRYYQDEANEAVKAALLNGKNPIINLATGCHAKGTKIIMFDGSLKNVEDVQEGDTIMGDDSTPRRVLRTVSNREMMYKITPKRSDSFVVNEGHILSLISTNEGKKYPCNKTGKEIVNISVKDYLTKSKYWRHVHKLYKKPIDFAKKELAIDPYIMGLVLGDGCLKNTPSLTTMDQECADYFCQYVESIGCKVRKENKPNNRASSYLVSAVEKEWRKPSNFKRLFSECGLWGKTAEYKFIPQEYKASDRNQRLELLAGLMDSDGHMNCSGFDFVSKSKQLADDVVYVALSLGLSAKSRKCIKGCQNNFRGEYHRVSISGDCSIVPTKIPRQKAKKRKQIKRNNVHGFDIEPIGVGQYYGFSLDKNHLYMTGDFFIHHNTGKSVCQMQVAEWIINTFPGTRVMCLTHESTLIAQNHSKMPLKYNAGIYSAGIGKRDVHNQVIFAGIQSIYKKANLFAPVGIVIIDEVQLLSPEEDTMYQTFISGLREHNPDMLCYGLSATPFRTKHGMITDCTFFDEIVYSYSIADGINDGYLAHLTSKRGTIEVDRSQIKMTAGEFNKKHMAKAFDKNDITAQAVAEIKAYGATRKSWMIFCTDIDHCNHVSDYMQDIPHAVVSSKHDKDHNEWAIEAHKKGHIKCIINVAKLTVGYDNPMVDLIVLLRSMGSPGLYCQILGRGTRPVYAQGFDLSTREGRFAAMAAGSKPNGCLVLDYGQNIVTHGPVDKIVIEKKYNTEKNIVEDAISCQPTKMCPSCRCDNHVQATQCPECGYEYPIDVKHETVASDAAILSADIEPEWFDVQQTTVSIHKKAGKPDSLKVTYLCGIGAKSEWVCLGHEGYARTKAVKWWKDRAGTECPASAHEAASRSSEIISPMRISVKPDGKYERIVDYEDWPDGDNDQEQSHQNTEQLSELDEWAEIAF